MSRTTRSCNGLLLQERTTYDLADPELAAFALTTGVDAAIGRAVELAAAVLRDDGLPDHLGWFGVRADGGYEEFATTEEMRPRRFEFVCWTIHPAWSVASPVKAVGKALAVLFAADRLRDARQRGDVDGAVEAAFRVGAAAEALSSIAAGWPMDAYRGRRARFGAAKGNTVSRAKSDDRDAVKSAILPEARRLRALHPTWSNIRIARQIVGTGRELRTIRRMLAELEADGLLQKKMPAPTK